MSTVINNPGEREDSSVSLIVGTLLAILLLFLFFFYGLPAIRDSAEPREDDINVDVNLPPVQDGTNGGTDDGTNTE